MEISYRHFEKINSTNDWAKAHLDTFSKEALTVIWADSQTAGRGQYGRSWISPSGVNLYATFVFWGENDDPLSITHLLALSALSLFPFDCLIKWPNDLLVNGKKIGGILCENISSGEIVLGIGINVNMTEHQLKSIDQPATSLLVESGKTYSLLQLLQSLADRFSKDLMLYKEQGFKPFELHFQEKLKTAKHPY